MKLCSKCKKPFRRKSARYCKKCHAAYMIQWRKTHPLNQEQRRKMIARSYTKTYIKRGKLIPKPCRVCGNKAQVHHPDYSKPLEVDWLCRKHHIEIHSKEK